MSKTLKIVLNVLTLALVVGFGYYMVRSMSLDNQTYLAEQQESNFVSPYKLIDSFEFDSDVLCFDVFEDKIYTVLSSRISVVSSNGRHLNFFGGFFANTRDMVVNHDGIFLLSPTNIELFSFEKKQLRLWEACSPNSDYVAITTSKNYIFVTDAENKNIVQYNKDGSLVRFITSPNRFIIPSLTFDIININDTIYVANSGRHQIESYTLNGEFISSFGKSGSQVGAFAGCCNPVFLAATSAGNILTSEKGNPRISSYSKDGKFRSILFDANMLGGGTDARRMKVFGENIYIAHKNTISVYTYDCKDARPCVSTKKKSCNDCKKPCQNNSQLKN
jgi:WD40 repeat protein